MFKVGGRRGCVSVYSARGEGRGGEERRRGREKGLFQWCIQHMRGGEGGRGKGLCQWCIQHKEGRGEVKVGGGREIRVCPSGV